MSFKSIAISTLPLAMLTACATIDANGNSVDAIEGLFHADEAIAISLNKAMPYTMTSDVRTAKSGDMLFEQKVTAVSGIKLKKPYKLAGIPGFGATYNISENDILYPLLSIKYGMIYCTRDHSGKALLGREYRGCLRDSNDDKKLDQFWKSDEIDTKIYSGYPSLWLAHWRDGKFEEPLEYEEIDSSDMPESSFGVKFTYANPLLAKENIRFSPVAMNNKGQYSKRTLDDARQLDPTGEFPQMVYVSGAKIEVLSYNDKTIEYRVIEGFKEGDPIFMAIQRQPQTVYVYY